MVGRSLSPARWRGTRCLNVYVTFPTALLFLTYYLSYFVTWTTKVIGSYWWDLAAEHARPSEEDFCQLMRDCSVMVGLHHENLSPVIAACLDTQLGRPLKLVYLASSDDDNLKLYLHQCRHSQVPNSVLTTADFQINPGPLQTVPRPFSFSTIPQNGGTVLYPKPKEFHGGKNRKFPKETPWVSMQNTLCQVGKNV